MVSIAVVTVAAIFFFTEGYVLFFARSRPLRGHPWHPFSSLTLALGVLGVASYLLVRSGVMVFGPEAGIVMIQKPYAWLVSTSLIAGFGLLVWLVWRIFPPAELLFRLGAIALAAILLWLFWDQTKPLNPAYPDSLQVVVTGLWWLIGLVLLTVLSQVYEGSRRQARRRRPSSRPDRRGPLSLAAHLHWRKPRLKELSVVIASSIMALTLIELLQFEVSSWTLRRLFFLGTDPLPTPVLLTIFMGVWILLAEATSGGTVEGFRQWVSGSRKVAGDLTRTIRRAWPRARGKPAAAGNGSGAAAQLARGFQRLVFVTLIALVGLFLLIALAEIPNRGKTIIEPFRLPPESTQGSQELGTAARQELGTAAAERLVNMVGVLRQELRPDAVVFGKLKTGPEVGKGRSPRLGFVTAAEVPSAVSTATAIGTWEIAGRKIPLEPLARLIQGPMRALLGVRVVRGTVVKEDHGYRLLATSTYGEAWRPEFSRSSLPHALGDRVDELAMQIVVTEPSFRRDGGTASLDALKKFREGMVKWQRVNTGDQRALSEATNRFREATAMDPGFALANYRVGRALIEDQRPVEAAEFFRLALEANPEFLPGYLALAHTLDLFDSFYVAPTVSPLRPQGLDAAARRDSPRRLWQQVALLPKEVARPTDWASAYFGLCDDARQSAEAFTGEWRSKTGRDLSGDDWRSVLVPALHRYYVAYFFCKRAERLHAEFSPEVPVDPEIRGNEAALLNNLGVILTKIRRQEWRVERTKWHCHPATLLVGSGYAPGQRKLWRSPHDRAALRYFARALALTPENADADVVSCNAATVALLLDDGRSMEALKSRPSVHFTLAQGLLDQASNGDERFFRPALDEFEETIDRDPDNVFALNAYANVFWRWRYNFPSPKQRSGDSPGLGRKAERFARRAETLSSNASPDVQAAVLSTVGEVLLAEGRPEEAEKSLRKAVDAVKKLPQPFRFDEIRWELAQAYLCSARLEEQLSGAGKAKAKLLRSKAKMQLAAIRANEQGREFRPFTDSSGLLAPAGLSAACPSALRQPVRTR